MADGFRSSSIMNRTPPQGPTLDQPAENSTPEPSIMDRPNTPVEQSRPQLEPVPATQEQGRRSSPIAGRNFCAISGSMSDAEMNDMRSAALEVLGQIQLEQARRNVMEPRNNIRESYALNPSTDERRGEQRAYARSIERDFTYEQHGAFARNEGAFGFNNERAFLQRTFTRNEDQRRTASTARNEQQFRESLMAPELMDSGISCRTLYSGRRLPKLPQFSGAIRSWPMFIQSYTRTTADYRITELENIERLNECLTGQARRSVETLLCDPYNIFTILNSLRVNFGNPELVGAEALARLNGLPRIESSLINLPAFATEIRHIKQILKSCGLECELKSRAFLPQLEKRIPNTLIAFWIQEKSRVTQMGGAVDFLLFSEWIENFGQQTALVHGYKEFPTVSGTERGSEKKVMHIQNGTGKKIYRCAMGCNESHPLRKCWQFLKMDSLTRLNKTRELGLCSN